MLYDLLIKDYTYLEFWSHKCFYCKKSHEILNEINRKYYSVLNIVSISMEKSKKEWKKASKKDKIVWTNINELKGDYSDIHYQFKVNSTPRGVLIDKNGVIIENNLHPKDLEKRLSKI